MIWLLAAAFGAAVFIVRTPTPPLLLWAKIPEPTRVPGPPPGQEPTLQQGSTEVQINDYAGEKFGPWLCRRGDKVPIPDIASFVPPHVINLGGPIVNAALTMIGIVRNIFEEIGASKVCTVRGGRWVPVVFWDRLPAREVHVNLEPFYGGAPAGRVTFASSPSKPTDTVDLPLVDEIVEPSPRQIYLMKGGVPPGDLWPHDPGTPSWKAYMPTSPVNYDAPQAKVVLSPNGDLLTLYVWLPPRAPRSHNTIWGIYKIDHPVTWRISWWLA